MRYLVKIRREGAIDSQDYSGIRHKSKERAEKELHEAALEMSLNGIKANCYLVERPCIVSPGAINDIISICSARNGERCRDCVAGGEPCEDLKRIYWVSKPMYIEIIDCDEETED